MPLPDADLIHPAMTDRCRLMLQHLDTHGPFWIRRLRARYGDLAVDRAERNQWTRRIQIIGGDATVITKRGRETLHGSAATGGSIPSIRLVPELLSIAALSYHYTEVLHHELFSRQVEALQWSPRKLPKGVLFFRLPDEDPRFGGLMVIALPRARTRSAIKALIRRARSFAYAATLHVYVPHPAYLRVHQYETELEATLYPIDSIEDAALPAHSAHVVKRRTATRPAAR